MCSPEERFHSVTDHSIQIQISTYAVSTTKTAALCAKDVSRLSVADLSPRTCRCSRSLTTLLDSRVAREARAAPTNTNKNKQTTQTSKDAEASKGLRKGGEVLGHWVSVSVSEALCAS
eukprot:scaffold1735_cov119-Isochrysis_galbana.AAC.5